MTAAIDDLAIELHEGVHVQMTRQAELGWPSDVERLIYHALDTALALFLAFLGQLEGQEPEHLH